MTDRANGDKGFFLGIGLGTLAAVLSMAVPEIAIISDQPLIGVIQEILMLVIIPGLIGSAGASGNSHAFSLLVAALINGLFWMVFGWLLYFILARIRGRRSRKASARC